MGSRVQENVRHFFECFCEVAPPTPDKEAWIIQQYPTNYHDADVLKSVPKFAYPYKFENTVVQHYSFVLTGIESKWTYGFCRHFPGSETAIVVLSFLPWHQAFYKFLDTIAQLMIATKADSLVDFLTAIYDAHVADPGRIFTVAYSQGDEKFSIEVPCQFQLPSIPENRNLTEYYNAVDTNNMMVIFASMLYERRIIFTSKKLNRLSACVQSANDIIYPMIWQHIFIPVLPMALIDYLLAPMPFLIGVPEVVLKKVNRHEIGEVVILDADTNTVDSPFDDLNNFPQEVITCLRKDFKNKAALLGDGVPRTFLRALVQLIGGYRDGIKFENAQKITFDEQKFIESRPLTFQAFLRQMLHLQIFQQFIEERLIMLNNGWALSDEFEIETFRYSVQSGSKFKQQYKDWTTNMKKDGAAFFKSVKQKANPAVKTAVKTMKDGRKGMKSAYKGLKSRLRENSGPQQLHNDPISPHKEKQPRSAPSSPVAAKYHHFQHISSERATPIASPMNTSNSGATVVDACRSDSTNVMFPHINLMDEIQDLLQLHLDGPSTSDRTLKPVRSLENFNKSSATNCPTTTNSNDNNSNSNGLLFPPKLPSLYKTSTNTSGDLLLFNSPVDGSFPKIQSSFFSPSSSSTSGQSSMSCSPLHTSSPISQKRNCVVDDDSFCTTQFIVGGGHSENGDALFLVGDRNCVDVVKLAPPPSSFLFSIRNHSNTSNNTDTKPSNISSVNNNNNNNNISSSNSKDLIHLGTSSTNDIDEFDPLKNRTKFAMDSVKCRNTNSTNDTNDNSAVVVPLSITNPLYEYAHFRKNASFLHDEAPEICRKMALNTNDQGLLQEYGLDFDNFNVNDRHQQSLFDPFETNSNITNNNNDIGTKKPKHQWTTFD